jgi:hypothetical protein
VTVGPCESMVILAYLAVLSLHVHNRLSHFPTIIALVSIHKSYRRKIKGKLVLIEDGIAHFEKDKHERLVWEVVDELVGRLEFIGSRQVRIISSQPLESYCYSELFHFDHHNNVIHLLGPFPRLCKEHYQNPWGHFKAYRTPDPQ